MSDKFFFKGRQDARKNHVKSGYKTKANQKLGTKKYPLELVVTSESRQLEIEKLASDAELHTIIRIDTNDGAIESIEELTALLNKTSTVILDKVPARNEPCVCGSGKKYKKCCA